MKSEFILPSAYALIDVDDGTVTDECGKKLKTIWKNMLFDTYPIFSRHI